MSLGGAWWSPMHFIYNYAWFVGFGMASLLYWLLSRGVPAGGLPTATARAA